MREKWHADYDKAEVTPPENSPAVGIVGGGEDDTFAREDGAEVRAAAAKRGEDTA